MDLNDVLSRLRKVRQEGSQWKAQCPAHDDSSPSLAIRQQGGRILLYCHGGCSPRAVLDALGARAADLNGGAYAARPESRPEPLPVLPNLAAITHELQQAFWSSAIAKRYVEDRGIPLAVAESLGIGWAEYGKWPHYFQTDKGKSRLCRQINPGRVVFPHSDLDGQIINLYGRAGSASIARDQRHDHLSGNRGVFNAPAIVAARRSGDTLWICEGPFDAAAAITAGAPHAIAIFGLKGWRVEWIAGIERIVVAFDNDEPGRESARQLVKQLGAIAPNVRTLPREAYGKGKDVNEAWLSGALPDFLASNAL